MTTADRAWILKQIEPLTERSKPEPERDTFCLKPGTRRELPLVSRTGHTN